MSTALRELILANGIATGLYIGMTANIFNDGIELLQYFFIGFMRDIPALEFGPSDTPY